jgi:hypothetical protein
MPKSQKEAIQKELLERATGKGKEPSWEGMPTKLQLVKALNFYSATVEADQLQKYAIAWAKKFSPDNVELIGAQANWKFQTVGALMRIVTRGLTVPKPHLQTILDFVNGLEMPEAKETSPSKTKGKKKIMIDSENVNYRNFCDALDAAVAANKFKDPKLEVVKGHSVTPVVDTCERELASMKEDPSIYPEHMKKWFRAVIKNMGGGSTPAPVNDAVKTVKKVAKPAAEAVVAEPVADKAPKAKAAPKPVVAKAAAKPKVEPEAVNDPNCPLTGKSHAFLFDTRYGRLIKLVAAKGQTFKVTGKTIHGICEQSSKVALLKNFGDLPKNGANEDLDAWMGKCVKKGNPIPVSTRTAKEVIVLKAA